MRRIKNLSCLAFLFLGIISSTAYSQTLNVPDSLLSKTLLIIDTAEISAKEFVWFHNKYNSYLQQSLQIEPEVSLQFFIDYKKKIIEAERQQLDSSQQFKKEFNTYYKTNAETYLYRKDSVRDSIAQLSYQRMLTDIDVKQIFIQSYRYNNPNDTLKAYQKATKIATELKNGANFDAYLQTYSDDKIGKEKHGRIGYVTGTVLPLSYENAIYTTDIGNIVGPISTEQGYYIAKVMDKRPTKGAIKASIIVLYYPQTYNKDSILIVQAKADSLRERAIAGENFDTLCYYFNTNQQLKESLGNSGWFDNSSSYDLYVKDALYALDSIGQITEPIHLEYGVVIAKLTGQSTLPPYEKYKNALMARIQRDNSRKDYEKKQFYNSYSKTAPYKEYSKNLQNFIAGIDSSLFTHTWKAPEMQKENTLFTLGTSAYTNKDFAAYLQKNQRHKNFSSIEAIVRYKFNDYAHKMMEEHAKGTLHQRSEEFANIMTEYHDGMIIYELLNKEVFARATSDTAKLLELYTNDTTDNYMQAEGIKGYIIQSDNSKLLKKVSSTLEKKQPNSQQLQTLLNSYNKKETKAILYDTILYYKGGENQEIEKLPWQQYAQYPKGNSIIYITEVHPKHKKTFEDAYNSVVVQYQDELEKKWTEELRKKYNHLVHEALLHTILSLNK